MRIAISESSRFDQETLPEYKKLEVKLRMVPDVTLRSPFTCTDTFILRDICIHTYKKNPQMYTHTKREINMK